MPSYHACRGLSLRWTPGSMQRLDMYNIKDNLPWIESNQFGYRCSNLPIFDISNLQKNPSLNLQIIQQD